MVVALSAGVCVVAPLSVVETVTGRGRPISVIAWPAGSRFVERPEQEGMETDQRLLVAGMVWDGHLVGCVEVGNDGRALSLGVA